MVNHKTARNAGIATAIALVAILASTPLAAAEEPTMEDDGSAHWGDCFELNPWTTPPSWALSVENCIDEV